MRNYLKVLDELDKKIAANPLDKSLTLAKDRLGKSSLTDAISKRMAQLDKIPYRPIVDLTNEEYQSPSDLTVPFVRNTTVAPIGNITTKTPDTIGGQNNLLPTPNNRQVDNRIAIAPLETPANGVTSLSRNPTLNAIAAGMDKKKVDTTTIDEDGAFDVGKAGTFIKGIAPTIFSAIDAFTTKDNVNAYQDYGREGLETLDTAKRDLNISLNQGKNDITNQVAGAKLANNNSARSLNVARALNLSSDLIGQDAQNKLAAQTSDRRINLDTAIATAENQRDAMVMKGADEKQVRDAEDRSKIISNFSGAAQAIGSSKEHIGKMVNEGNYNDDFLSTLSALFPNMNIAKNAKGDLTFTRKKAVG